MLLKLTHIITFGLVAFFLAMALYPSYIRLLKKWKMQQTIRDTSMTGDKSTIFTQLHQHKAGTPRMGGWLFLLIMGIMIGISILIQYLGYTTYNIFNTRETFWLLFWFFSMGILWTVDDIRNVRNIGKTKWLTATVKIVFMLLFSGFMCYRFYVRLGATSINMRPFGWEFDFATLLPRHRELPIKDIFPRYTNSQTLLIRLDTGIIVPIFFLIFTIGVVNAINITDGNDGQAGGMMTMVFLILSIVTIMYERYLATSILVIMVAVLVAFLWFNINPAKTFMGDGGAFAMGGLLAAVLMLLNFTMGIIFPFCILFALFWITFASSVFQVFRKKYFHKKLFPMAPLHHLLQHKWWAEHTIVMKYRLIQGVLWAIAMIGILYQFVGI